ncbi:MAG TPA: AAA family ATPase [Solirubrobacteraceae bacterium]|nr:AAA family ATPase [Solirubrobacteraceae bacterium]
MHLKALTMRGFKSFPDRTRLDFGAGVSVVVGPNGSGKSNITDAVLWAMGEQSPLAVRGQSMQDVIFGGAKGIPARSEAEVELLLDNSDGAVDLPLSEISVVRKLTRAGEGEYRLNGARCRLSEVIELLSDTGLGKETHSVISQGRVEAIVNSRARERRLLIEEAAGLGKHRKRRRRAQLKLERTQENLDRALDVEREARTRLRPLKRQAEAAQLHERLEHQMLQARLELTADDCRARGDELSAAHARATDARAARSEHESSLQATVDRRAAAEKALADLLARDDAHSERLLRARSAGERVGLRAEQVTASVELLSARIAHAERELEGAGVQGEAVQASAPADDRSEIGQQIGRRLRESKERLGGLLTELADVESATRSEVERALEATSAELQQSKARVEAAEGECERAGEERSRAERRLAEAREGRSWSGTWSEVRRAIEAGVRRALGLAGEDERAAAVREIAAEAEGIARAALDVAFAGVGAAEAAREQADAALRERERRRDEAREEHRRVQWLIEQRQNALAQGPLAVRKAELEGELAAERQRVEHLQAAHGERVARTERLRERLAHDRALVERARRLLAASAGAGSAIAACVARLEAQLAGEGAAGEKAAAELRECAAEEAQIHAKLRAASELVTEAEVQAQRARDQLAEVELERADIERRLGIDVAAAETAEGAARGRSEIGRQALEEEQRASLHARVERLARRREQLGPVNPLAAEEYREAVAHVEELEGRREDLETALRELRSLIADIDRQIERTFNETFQAAADNFEELVGDLFPGGSGALRLVRDAHEPRAVLGGSAPSAGELEDVGVLGETPPHSPEAAGEDAALAAAEQEEGEEAEEALGVEIEITPAGKSTRRLSLLSGGEKSMTALAFLFAVFLARPCPFYILDEVEAALDDLNLDRFLTLLRRHCARAQFIVITHQKRTMEAADALYGVSMGGDGVSKVISRRLPAAAAVEVAEVA